MTKILPLSITQVRAVGYRSRFEAKAKAIAAKSRLGRYLDRRERRAQQIYSKLAA